MPDMLAVISKKIFEKLTTPPPQLGDSLPLDGYDSKTKALNNLGDADRLFLVTVHPPDEQLWLVAILNTLTFTGERWQARGANTTPITDITHLRGEIKFTSGKGISQELGKLGMSLQTPRALSDRDTELLCTAAAIRVEVEAPGGGARKASGRSKEEKDHLMKEPVPLTTLENSDWNKLEHAYGPASDTPDHLRALASSDPKQRKAAWDALGGSIYHQGSVYPATVAAVPVLIELLENESVVDKPAILEFLHMLLTGDPTAWLTTGLDMSNEELVKSSDNDTVWLEVVKAVSAGYPTYITLLSDKELKVRAHTAHLLGYLSEGAEEVAPVVREAVVTEHDPVVKASELLCLSFLGRYRKTHEDLDLFRELAASREDELVRATAVIAAVNTTAGVIPDDVIAQLKEIGSSNIGHDELPWASGDLSYYAKELMKAFGFGPKFNDLFEAVKQKVASLELDPDGTYEQWTNERYNAWKAFQEAFWSAFPKAVGEHEELLPEELTRDQRTILEFFADSEPLWKWEVGTLFFSRGIIHAVVRVTDPGTYKDRWRPVPLRRFLGVDPPIPWDTRIHIRLDGVQRQWPVWKAIRWVLAAKLKHHILIKAVNEQLSPEIIQSILRCILIKWDWIVPLDGWRSWSGMMGSELRTAKEEYIERLLALVLDLNAITGDRAFPFAGNFSEQYIEQEWVGMVPAFFVIETMARHSPDGCVDEKYASLLEGNLARAGRRALAAFSVPVRERLVLSYRLVRQDRKRYIDDGYAWNFLDLCPTGAAAEKVIDALRKMGRKELEREKYIDALVSIGEAGVLVIKEALGDKKIAQRDILLEALTKIAPASSLTELKEALLGSSKPLQDAAIRLLVGVGEVAEPLLVEIEKSKSKKERNAAALVRTAIENN